MSDWERDGGRDRMRLKSIDTGWTACCPGCDLRHENDVWLIGENREVAIKRCPPCQKLEDKKTEERQALKPKRKRSY